MPAPAVLYGAHNGSTWATLSRPSTLLPLARVSEGGGGGDPLARILPSIQSLYPPIRPTRPCSISVGIPLGVTADTNSGFDK